MFLGSPPGFPMFSSSPSLMGSTRLLPFMPPPSMFPPGAVPLPHTTTMPTDPVLQFPQVGEQQNSATFWQALSLFGNILRNNQSVTTGNEAIQQQQSAAVEPIQTGSDNTDEHIDRMLDEMVMGQMRNEHQQQNENITKERLCILPIPIFIPIPLPLTSEFITKHYGI